MVLRAIPFFSLAKCTSWNNRRILSDQVALPGVDLQLVDTLHDDVGIRATDQVRARQDPFGGISTLQNASQARNISRGRRLFFEAEGGGGQ